MSGVWQQSIVRVLDSAKADVGYLAASSTPGAVIGTGALVLTPQYGTCVLTAAHVINAALGWNVYATGRPGDDLLVRFDLPAKGVGAGRIYFARVVEWAPPRTAAMRAQNPVSDIALLQVVDTEGGGSLPAELRLFRPEDFEVVSDADLEGLPLRSFGFLRPDGAFAEGKVQGTVASGWLHLVAASDKGDFIAPGFSGAPMFDAGRQRILGMAIAIDPDDDKRLAFLQSTRNIWKACPELARPYPGLRAFEERDAPFFYGRDAFVARMLEKTRSCPLLGVTAASGSGKSSAIRAGLIPKLRASARTVLLVMRPLSDPWKQLALAITRLSSPDADILTIDDQADSRARLLRESPQKLLDYAQGLLATQGADRLIIFVDQFEELFTLAGHEREEPEMQHEHLRTRNPGPDFRDLMASTARLAGSPQLQWIYALRGDFFGKAFTHRGFADAVNDGNVTLADMTADELHAAISRPAHELGVVFDGGTATQPGLIARIAEDAGATAGALPLMQHVLDQLWREMRDRSLTHEAYERLGGLTGALNLHADRVFGSLSKEEQSLARRLFSRLVNIEEDGEATRRVAARRELQEKPHNSILTLGSLPKEEQLLARLFPHAVNVEEATRRVAAHKGVKKNRKDSVWALVQKLAGEDSRLLTLSGVMEREGRDARPTEEMVEVAHEALLRDWEKLRGWIAEDRNFLSWRRRLEQQLRDHRDAADKSGTWLTGGPLQIAITWRTSREGDLSQEEQAFISASETIEAEEAEKAAEEAKQKTALLQQKAALFKRLIILLFAFFAVAVGAAFGGFSLWENQKAAAIVAQTTRISAEDEASRYAAAIADRLMDEGHLTRALKVSRAHLPATFFREQLARKPAAFAALAQAVSYFEQDPSVLRGHESAINAASFSPDGGRLVTTSDDTTARLWDATTGRAIAALIGHEDTVLAASFSPDGTRVVTASEDRTARLWNAITGRLLAVLKGHDDGIFAASFSPDGTLVVTASRDNTARLWDGASGRPLAVLKGHEGTVYSASFSPDGTRIVTASLDATARLWDAATGRSLIVLKGHEKTVVAASFSPDGTRVVTASMDATARLWDTLSGRAIAMLEGHSAEVNGASFSADGRRVVTASGDKTARLWDAATGRPLAVLKHEESVVAASFSPDATRVITASRDKTARLWYAASGRSLAVLNGHGDAINEAAFSPDGARVVTVSDDTTARLWDAASGRPLAVLKGHEGAATVASFSLDGARIITASTDNTARLWDAASGRPLAVLKGHEGAATAAAFSPDRTRVITASDDKTARLWDAVTGRPLAVLKGHEEAVRAASFSPDGTRMVTSGDSTARLWDAATGRPIAVLEGHERGVTAASFSPDGARVVTGSSDTTARLWDAATGRPLAVLEGHEFPLSAVSFSSDGARIVTASANPLPFALKSGLNPYIARLWDTATGRPLAVLKGHVNSITAASFSPDGTRVLTASADRTARLWDAATGRPLAVLKGHEGRVFAASFSPDGTRVVTGSGDSTARLWNVTPATMHSDANSSVGWTLNAPFSQALLDRADLIIPEKLTEEEREELLKETSDTRHRHATSALGLDQSAR